MIRIIKLSFSLLFFQNMAFSLPDFDENDGVKALSKIDNSASLFVKNNRSFDFPRLGKDTPSHTHSFFLDSDDDDEDSDPDYESKDGDVDVGTPVNMSGIPNREVKQKRPFVPSRALQENLPRSPQELSAEQHSRWSYFDEGAFLSYAGMTRGERAKMKEIGYQFMMPSPPKRPRPPKKNTIKNSRRLFETSEELKKLQGFSRKSYRFMVTEGRVNLSLEDGLRPILDYFQAQRNAGNPVTPDDTNKLFWQESSSFFDIQEKIGDHIFCLNSTHIQGTDALTRIAQGRNPLLKTDGVIQRGDYHHLTQGMSSPEIIVYVSADFHANYHDVLHQFLKPGQDSIAHGVGAEREWGRAKKAFHQILEDRLGREGEQKEKDPNIGKKRPADFRDHDGDGAPFKKRHRFF